MQKYILRRILLMVPTLFGITLMVFALTRLTPGGPVERILMSLQLSAGEGGDSGGSSGPSSDRSQPLSEDQIAFLNEFYGLDKPILSAYLDWVRKVFVLDLGESTRYWEPVWDMIRSKLPISLYYGIVTFIIIYGISIPLGVLKAIRHKTTIDAVTSILIFIGFAVPNFVVGIGLLVLFGYQLEWFPMGGFVSDEFENLGLLDQALDVIRHSVLPLIAWVIGSFAWTTMFMKNNLLENLAADYIRTAMAKGNTFGTAVKNHALRNSLVPLAAGFGHIISLILTGSFLLEVIFNIDGMGLLAFESAVERDYPVVMGILLLSSILLLVGNLLSDLCVATIDPRVKDQFR